LTGAARPPDLTLTHAVKLGQLAVMGIDVPGTTLTWISRPVLSTRSVKFVPSWRGSLNAPKAAELLRRREMSRCARSGHCSASLDHLTKVAFTRRENMKYGIQIAAVAMGNIKSSINLDCLAAAGMRSARK
jgi:hypothetical protein